MPTSNKIKKNGIVYTPYWIVDRILYLSKYDYNICNKKVIDPSCGDGAFLRVIVKRFITDAQNNGHDNEDIAKLLENNIYGVDIDRKAIESCKLSLNKICNYSGIANLQWSNIITANTLSEEILKEYMGKFDFVFGNPPYVRIQNLSSKTRKIIDKDFKLCKHGSTDLYIAFFELGFSFLNASGVLGYITPSSFLNTTAGLDLRKFLWSEQHIEALVDFSHYQLFDNATTYAAITIYNKSYLSREINMYSGNNDTIWFSCKLNIQNLEHDMWILAKTDDLEKINLIKNQGTPLGKLCKIHTGIATLKDDLFIFHDPMFDDKTAQISLKDGRKFQIEKSILKRIIKASTWKSADDDQKLFVIFPYYNQDEKNVIIPEKMLREKFPLAFKYFSAVKQELNQRDKGKPNSVAWYAFGRSQGVNNIFGKKLITAAINKEPRFILCEDEEALYYAGYSVVYDGNLKELSKKLNSNDMKIFIDYTSKNYLGGWKSYSKSFIKNFGVVLDTRQ